MIIRIFILILLIGAAFKVSAGELSSVNNSKLKAVYDALPKTDGNGDGTLTLAELREYVQAKFKDRATSRSNLYMSRFFKYEPTADYNRDGVLTKLELLHHLREPI
jgi:hypothetical protein